MDRIDVERRMIKKDKKNYKSQEEELPRIKEKRAAAGQCDVKLLAKYNTEIFMPEEILTSIEKLQGGSK